MNKKLVNLLIGVQFLTKLCQRIYNMFNLIDFVSNIIQSTLVNSTMHNSILSLIST